MEAEWKALTSPNAEGNLFSRLLTFLSQIAFFFQKTCLKSPEGGITLYGYLVDVTKNTFRLWVWTHTPKTLVTLR